MVSKKEKEEFELIQVKDHTKKIKKTMENVAKDFLYIGFLLWEVKYYGYYKELGYKNVVEYAEKELNFKKAATYNFIAVAEKFSRKTENGQPTMQVSDEFKEYNFSQLVEILPLKPGEEKQVNPGMTQAEIREVKGKLKEDKQDKEKTVIEVEFKEDKKALKENQVALEIPQALREEIIKKEVLTKYLHEKYLIMSEVFFKNKGKKDSEGVVQQAQGYVDLILDLIKDFNIENPPRYEIPNEKKKK